MKGISVVLFGLQASIVASSALLLPGSDTVPGQLDQRQLLSGLFDFLLPGLAVVTTSKTTSTVKTTSATSTSTSHTSTSTTKTTSTVSTSTSTAKTSSTSTAKTTSTSTAKTTSASTVKTSSASTATPSATSTAKVSATSTTKVSTTSTTGTSTVTSLTSTASTSSASLSSNVTSSAAAPQNTTVALDAGTIDSTILILARDADSARQASSGLNGYGIPFQILLVPSDGVELPTLNSSSAGNFGGFIALSGLSYDYGNDNWRSALTDAQWSQLYSYQIAFGVRMVQLDVYPQAAYGTSVIGSCCDSGVEQLISFSNTTAFAQAGLKTGAGMSTQGLYHYATEITDPSTTWEVAQFAANSQYSSPSTAGVINNFSGREQMVFFTSWATDWSPTSNFLQHAFITWMTRGLYAGYRRVNLNAQIDDMMLSTPIYNDANGTRYRVTPGDMSTIRDWVPTINAKMNPGSFFKPEAGYNGDGNLIEVDPSSSKPECDPHPIFTGYNPTTAEFKKPLGTGVDLWPSTAPSNYTYSSDCLNQDELSQWYQVASNRDQLMHISHTFTHEHLNNATYNDVYREISFNQHWLNQVGISQGTFSPKGLIPPAITGLHNGDALQAFWDLGLRNAVGDNARPALRNTENPMWPYITNTATDGFAGFTVVPRWPLRIYWDCDSKDCTLSEWTNTGGGSGDFANLILNERNDMIRYFFGLYHDGAMFHQINLRSTGMTPYTTADGTQVSSLYQTWVETIVQEFTRLSNWPMIALKQDDLATAFTDRMARDQCNYAMTWNMSGGKTTGVTVTADGNTCPVAIPITVPGSVVDTKGFVTEKVGNDPLTVWVKLTGSPVTLTLSSPL
ncbi:hypothetical protein P153DRAFT_364804 [Dothidotthia symphoricarpi CBS 119687]|uniref:Extracellular serine-rich protein n=1 Tax=Dothidotthia symphoricarpi CBS 119687 TaxID=1392245 RepID=A0A6A6APG6_9PLEO|nr:uncharacterized protein P153DRAFT_364804 [Dothidotthia symphoricarpi CBS 119687]KAF2132401.1 hypothetical protein P153DRAFT_364804 [Dothidotthia symphoricarpi CBS 119687]